MIVSMAFFPIYYLFQSNSFVNRYLLRKISFYLNVLIFFYSFSSLVLLFYVTDLVYWMLFTQQPFHILENQGKKYWFVSFWRDFHSRNSWDCLYFYLFIYLFIHLYKVEQYITPFARHCQTKPNQIDTVFNKLNFEERKWKWEIEKIS